MLQEVSHSTGHGRPATYEDLLRVPDHLVAEIVDGELYTSPRPAFPHARAGTRLGGRLDPFQQGGGGPGGWWILFEPELHLGSDILVPDLVAWRVERMPEFPDTAFATLAPDWVCEILSPSTARLDRAKKLEIYARERVSCVWLLDPIAQTLEVLTLDGGHWVIQAIHQANDSIRAVPFEAMAIDLAYLWGETASEAISR
ncbi:MAG: Uma2 family endonuclease [Luteitalea sp.]|nr:Uma2 family endonuclease [Luteitalea sp.]